MGRIVKVDVGDHQKLESQIDKLLKDAWEYGVKADFSSLLLPDQKQLSQVKSGMAAIKRSLMGFDQLNRLVARSGSSTTVKENDAQKAYERLKQMIEIWNTARGRISAVDVESKTLSTTLGSMARVALDAMTGMDGLDRGIEAAGSSAGHSGSSLSRLKDTLGLLSGSFEKTQNSAIIARQGMENAFLGINGWFQMQVTKPVQSQAATLWKDLEPGARSAWRSTKSVFSDASSYFSTTFGNAWKTVRSTFSTGGEVYEDMTSGVANAFKKVVNKLITGINKVIAEPFQSINSIFSKLRNFSIQGYKPFAGMNFNISAPTIPLLARGAVLPANKPFMAVVGDQRHGTNIEAPLETIQEAVALVMGDVVEAEMAGHNATVQLLRQILEAVLGISLDEGTVARAVERYQGKMTVVTGGF